MAAKRVGDDDSSSQWIFSLEELSTRLPSLEHMTFAEENAMRRKICAFAQELVEYLRFPQLTTATAHVFIHRFYVRESFNTYDGYDIATACVFLAGKVEETPKRLKDVVIASHYIQSEKKQQMTEDSEDYRRSREKLLDLERVILQAICFDLTVEHPYRYLLSICKKLDSSKAFAQASWCFVNDSFRTTLCLRYPPLMIALAAIQFAGSLIQQPISATKGENWMEAFGGELQTVNAITAEIVDLYEGRTDNNAS